MGGKKIGACEAQIVTSPAPLSGDRLPAGSGSKASVGYAGIVKMGLREGREVLGGVNGNTKSSPERISECAASSIKANGNGVVNTNNPVDHYSHSLDHPLDDSLSSEFSEFSLHRGETAGGQLESLDSVSALSSGRVESCAVDLENGGGSLNLIRHDPWQPPEMDYEASDAGMEQQVENTVRELQFNGDELESLEEREFRPAPLILPEGTNMGGGFVGMGEHLQQPQLPMGEPVYIPPQAYLSSSLVSPHDVRHNLLDPNAQEYTPSTSPALVSNVSFVQPTPYQMDPNSNVAFYPAQELTPIMYSVEYPGGPVTPVYGNPGQVYGPMAPAPRAPAPLAQWDSQHFGVYGQGAEFPHQQTAGVSAAHFAQPSNVGQPPAHHLRPFATGPSTNSNLHSFLSTGCSSPIGAPSSSSVPGFSVPSLTGREHVSRALLLSGVPTELTDLELKQELEVWGLVRALGLERRHEGLVTTHYFDLRHSKEALRDIQFQHLLHQQRMQHRFQEQMNSNQQQQHYAPGRHGAGGHATTELQYESNIFFDQDDPTAAAAAAATAAGRGLIGGKAVWAQFTIPMVPSVGPDSHNQGTLVVFNLDVEMPLDDLRAAFEVYGAVKELRETPQKKQHKFVEFFDVRDAARALAALDGREIGGKRVKIEFSRPGGAARRARALALALANQGGASYANMIGNRLNPVSTMLQSPVSQQPLYIGWGADPSLLPPQQYPQQYAWGTNYNGPSLSTLIQQQQWNYGQHGQFQPVYQYIHNSQPAHQQYNNQNAPGVPQFAVDNRQYSRGGFTGTPNILQAPASSYHHSTGFVRNPHAYQQAQANNAYHHANNVYQQPTNNTYHGSSSRGVSDDHGRRRREQLNDRGPILRTDRDTRERRELPHNVVEILSGKRSQNEVGSTSVSREPIRDISIRHNSRIPMQISTRLTPREQAQYMFNPDPSEMSSEHPRTTLMIKNIPNKYSQGMLLTLLDQHCRHCNNANHNPNEPQSAYDFVYLPIDFKNRCNLGYAFVNFTTVQATLLLYKAFHMQQWEAFNSRKICEIAYARVQGRMHLEEHFKNSRFACDTDAYLPLVFQPPRTGIVMPPPMVAAGHLAGGRPVICLPRPDNTQSLMNPHRIVDMQTVVLSGSDNSSGPGESSSQAERVQEAKEASGDDDENSDSSAGSTGAGDVATTSSAPPPPLSPPNNKGKGKMYTPRKSR